MNIIEVMDEIIGKILLNFLFLLTFNLNLFSLINKISTDPPSKLFLNIIIIIIISLKCILSEESLTHFVAYNIYAVILERFVSLLWTVQCVIVLLANAQNLQLRLRLLVQV